MLFGVSRVLSDDGILLGSPPVPRLRIPLQVTRSETISTAREPSICMTNASHPEPTSLFQMGYSGASVDGLSLLLCRRNNVTCVRHFVRSAHGWRQCGGRATAVPALPCKPK
jgi:hypothetical protein